MAEYRVSSKDVARQAGVSQATVSYVMNNTPGVKIKPETRRLVLDAAARLNYHTNRMARNMRLRRASSVGIVTSKEISSQIFTMALEGVKSVLLQRNYSMTMCLTPLDSPLRGEYVSYYHSHLIDGLIFLLTTLTSDEELYLLRNNIPYVVINSHPDPHRQFQVQTSMGEAADAAVGRFLARGAREIGFIGNAALAQNGHRFSCYLAALERHHVAYRPQLSRRVTGTDAEIADGIAAYFADLERPPDALFCDAVSTGFLVNRYALANGIAIPNQLATVTIGTNPFSTRAYPALSAIEAPLYDMGRQGCRLLFEILDELDGKNDSPAARSDITLKWAFCERETT